MNWQKWPHQFFSRYIFWPKNLTNLNCYVTPVKLRLRIDTLPEMLSLHVLENVHVLVVLLLVCSNRISLSRIPEHVVQDGHLAVVSLVSCGHVGNAQVRAVVDSLRVIYRK